MPTHVLDQTFENIRREFDSGCGRAADRTRAELLQNLNQLFRRFRSYTSESEWIETTLDAAAGYASQIALFSITNNTLQLRGQRPAGILPTDLVFPPADAAAFSSVLRSKDPVTALRSVSEVSEPLSHAHETERAHLFPITNGDRVSAILFASDIDADMNALELVTGLASSVLERRANTALHAQIGNESPKQQTALDPPQAAVDRAWGELPPDVRQLHIRAQRFARVSVAELQLARPEACRAGREQGDLYLFLKREIDRARENYHKQFMTVSSMVDYLHLELIRTAALGDESKLGADYPGRLL